MEPEWNEKAVDWCAVLSFCVRFVVVFEKLVVKS